jgi:hypothetical protein
MELFIPSLIVLVLSALVCFFIIPKMSPYVLGSLAVAMFGLGIWQHYSTFPYEYRASMVSDVLRQYSGFIMLLAVIFAGTFGILLVHGGNPPAVADVIPEMPVMPNMPEMPEIPKNIFNLNGNATNNAVKPANNTSKAANATNNASKKNNLASASFKVV